MAQKRLFLKFIDNENIINTDIKKPNVHLSYPTSTNRVSLKKLVKTKMSLPVSDNNELLSETGEAKLRS
jgi:hypothetical protein